MSRFNLRDDIDEMTNDIDSYDGKTSEPQVMGGKEQPPCTTKPKLRTETIVKTAAAFHSAATTVAFRKLTKYTDVDYDSDVIH